MQSVIIYFVRLFMIIVPLLLIGIIMLQKGKGGGLAGAFGGMGGQSAFGTRAGDLFTKITIGLAVFWILLCIFGVAYFDHAGNVLGGIQNREATTDEGLPAGEGTEPASPPGPAEPAQTTPPAK